jgi:hypothetical protein
MAVETEDGIQNMKEENGNVVKTSSIYHEKAYSIYHIYIVSNALLYILLIAFISYL